MEEQLISFEVAVRAKQLGFYKETKQSYGANGRIAKRAIDYISGNTYPIVTQSLLQKWLREVHKTDITVITNWVKGIQKYKVGISYVENNKIEIWFSRLNNIPIEYNTYEEALEQALIESLNSIKNVTARETNNLS